MGACMGGMVVTCFGQVIETRVGRRAASGKRQAAPTRAQGRRGVQASSSSCPECKFGPQGRRSGGISLASHAAAAAAGPAHTACRALLHARFT